MIKAINWIAFGTEISDSCLGGEKQQSLKLVLKLIVIR